MRNSRTLIKGLVFASVLGTLGFAVAGSPVFPDTIVQVNVVKLDLIVTDRFNHSVDDLRQEDVQVFEDGHPRKIFLLDSEDKPAKYVVAIDASGSFKNLLASALETSKFIINNNRPEDETALIRFISSDKITTIQDFTADKPRLNDALKSFYIEGGQSAVIDAVYTGSEALAAYKSEDSRSRRAVVLITDGEDRASVHKLNALLKLLREKRIKLFVIGMVTELDKQAGFIRLSSRSNAEALLKELPLETGGRVFFPKSKDDLQRAAEEIAHDLHTQFVLGYQIPSPDEKRGHKIQVKIAGNKKLTAITYLRRLGK